MKKILLALLTLISVISYSQTPTTGHLRYDTVRIYKQNGNSNLIIENATRDSLGFLYNYGNGRTRFEVIRAVPGGIKVGNDTIFVAATPTCNDFTSRPSVTYTGSNRDFFVSASVINVNCVPYPLDSATLHVDLGDSLPRSDLFYADIDGYHVKKGTPNETPAVPTVDAGEYAITSILVPANDSLLTGISQIIVYNENTESTASGAGTTVSGASTAAPYIGSLNTIVTSLNHNDLIEYTIPSGFWDITSLYANQNGGLSLFIRNRAAMPSNARLVASLWVGSSRVSQFEPDVVFDKNSLQYQGATIPISAFGTISNTNVTKVRFRYVGPTSIFLGYYIDYIFFVEGLSQPAPTGGVTSFLITSNEPAFSFTGSQGSGNVNVQLNTTGNSSQYIRGDGTLATFNGITGVGTVNSQTKSTNGATTNGSNLILQDVDSSFRGLVTPAMKQKWDSVYTVEELSSLGYPIMVAVDATRTAFKRIVFDNVYKNTDSTIHIDTTGGGGGGSSLFPVTGTGTATGDVIGDLNNNDLTITDANSITLSANATGGTNFLQVNNGSDNLVLKSDLGSDESALVLFGDIFAMQSSSGIYTMTNLGDDVGATKVVTYNAGVLGTQDISGLGGGGGGSGLFPTTGTGTATGAVIGALAGNTFNINQGANAFLSIDPTANNETVTLQAYNTTGGDNVATFNASVTDLQSAFTFNANFDGGAELASIDAFVNSSSSSLNYTADIHTFNGAVRLAALAGNGAGVVTVDNDGDLSWLATPGGALNLSYDATNHEVDISGGGTSSVIPLSLADGATEGLASFNATYFDATSGNIAPDLTNGLASGSQGGWLSSADWTIFNTKFATNIFANAYSTPGDAETRYWYSTPAAVNSVATDYAITIDRTCTLSAITIDINCGTVAGSNEPWVVYVRNTTTSTDYAIATLSVSANRRTWSNNAINIPITAGDKITIKSITPTWATNPTGCAIFGYATFK